MLLIVRDAPEPFANVTDCDGLLDPTDVAGKDRLVGDVVAVVEGTTATPESATACGLLVAESTKLRVAMRVPAAVG